MNISGPARSEPARSARATRTEGPGGGALFEAA